MSKMDPNRLVNFDGNSLPAYLALKALYDIASPQGMGFLSFNPGPLPVEDAREMMAKTEFVDYLLGRPIKVKFNGTLDLRFFSRDTPGGDNALRQAAAQYQAQCAEDGGEG